VWPGKNVRRRGTDILRGVVLLPAGHRVGAGEIAVLASQRHDVISVHRRPLVAILSTGDELREIGDPADPGTIVGSNAPMLSALARSAGGVPWILPFAPDQPDAIVDRLREAERADVILSSGGVSVGEHDHVLESMRRAGFETVFYKVRIKPGKPLVFGRRGGTCLLGLPGNPVSSFVSFEAFARPLLRRLVGDPRPYGPFLRVRLGAAQRRTPGRPELARAVLRHDGGGWVADFHPRQTSGAMSSLIGADALVWLPSDAAELPAGTELDAIVLGSLPTDAALRLTDE
jgi:molybdopterin molybdotransferase